MAVMYRPLYRLKLAFLLSLLGLLHLYLTVNIFEALRYGARYCANQFHFFFFLCVCTG